MSSHDHARLLRNMAKGMAIALPVLAFELVLMQWPGVLQNHDRFSPFPVETLVVGVVAIGSALGFATPRDRIPVIFAVIGASLVLWGSGIGQQGVVQSTHPLSSADPLLRAYTVQALNVQWPWIIAGAAIGVGALIWVILRNRHDLRFFSVFPPAVLFLMGAGTSAIALLAGSFVVMPVDFTGRPARRRDATSGSGSERGTPADSNAWLVAARQEAESVVAFLDLEAQLKSVGAPLELAARCRAAAKDEARHARHCCSLARHSGASAPTTVVHGRRVERDWSQRGRLRRRRVIMRIALESLIDGAIGEGNSARQLESQAASAQDPRVAHTLGEIARDEFGHAQLGDDIVAWCRGEMPRAVGLGLRWADAEYRRCAGVGEQHVTTPKPPPTGI